MMRFKWTAFELFGFSQSNSQPASGHFGGIDLVIDEEEEDEDSDIDDSEVFEEEILCAFLLNKLKKKQEEANL